MSNENMADDNFRRPNVRRDTLPPAEKELTLYADDSPARPGNTPQRGDQDWTMKIPLHDGTRLNLHMGRASHANFTAMLAAEATDDAEEQLPRNDSDDVLAARAYDQQRQQSEYEQGKRRPDGSNESAPWGDTEK